MFTGIVTDLESIESLDKQNVGARLRIKNCWKDVELGESISVNGVCLTVETKTKSALNFYLSPETLEKTTLGQLKVGTPLNLERALRVGERLSGHFVQGHVDTHAPIVGIRKLDDATELKVQFTQENEKYLVEKGSIALDGISLTINKLENSIAYFMIIPHTWDNTNLHAKKPDEHVNVEFDMIAKMVLKV